MAVYCQNMTLGALSSNSALPVLVGALFKEFDLFLNTSCILLDKLCLDSVLLSMYSLFRTEAFGYCRGVVRCEGGNKPIL